MGRGDRVGLYLPMIPEVVIAQLAIGKIGAIYTPIFSGFGAEAVAARLTDCEARLLITCDGILRRGKLVPTKEQADAAVASAPSVEHVLVVERAGRGRDDALAATGATTGGTSSCRASRPSYATVHTDPEDPYLIIYTSGTTGRPKGVVHVHGGFPIKGAQDMAHCFDVQPTDTVFWLTDMGWMMGPWLVSGALQLGATALLYDGTPDYPGPDRLWSLVERHRVSVIGIAPTAIRALMRYGDGPVRAHDRSSLRVLGSSGEPWNPDPWRWYQDVVGEGRCPIINYSGGTEISGGIVASSVLAPQKPTSFAGPIPGMDADVVDEHGRSVRGTVGELVVRQPWPGMARGFWQRTRALPGDVLVAPAGRLGPRRLGARRRRGLLVHPGSIGRHDQDRRQTGRTGRSGVRGGGPCRGLGGSRDRRAGRAQGRAPGGVRGAASGARGCRAVGGGDRRSRGSGAGQVVASGPNCAGAGIAEDPQWQGDAARDPGPLPRPGTG